MSRRHRLLLRQRQAEEDRWGFVCAKTAASHASRVVGGVGDGDAHKEVAEGVDSVEEIVMEANH